MPGCQANYINSAEYMGVEHLPAGLTQAANVRFEARFSKLKGGDGSELLPWTVVVVSLVAIEKDTELWVAGYGDKFGMQPPSAERVQAYMKLRRK